MIRKSRQTLANVGAVLRVAGTAMPAEQVVDVAGHKRQLIADLCRILGQSVRAQRDGKGVKSPLRKLPNLSPRMRQTLERLLAGDSEKQIALHLGVSRHTVHVYVKAIYRGFDVCSRGELLARFVQAPIFNPTPHKRQS